MGPGNGGWGGPRYEYEKVQKPKNIKDVPRYLSELFGGFFYRLGYIFVIVWRASPLILFTMVFISIFDGIMPVIGITLPFFSYGGSSILTSFIAIGLVLSVFRQRDNF